MSWEEGPLCTFWTLALENNFTMPQLDFYTKVNDHGILWGNKGWILTWWWHPLTSRVSLDLQYWVMHSEFHRRIVMTCIGGTFVHCRRFFVWLIIAKEHSCSHYKLPTSYTNILYNVVCLFLNYGGPPTGMDAIWDTLADGARAIVDINREAGKDRFIC
jgi:hypothetical protein